MTWMGITNIRMSVVNQNVDTEPHCQVSLLSQIKIILQHFMIYALNKAFQHYLSQRITSTAKQVLGNCERMVLANFLGNMLSTFIL